ncbi:alpha/beta fold hydrolase [Paenibacillus eucommiae]|uniref:Pimeloyl-ACP methyl ester carboxylesterase n=1 Tax=Paenibacillus eucommiae TaxID=1355755 RepID=A0ABS4IQV2_9BACL|nr:alpha/beta hydrolase [Paenibacillus eucommiae]MBP1989952.1 pimeloyl-ACP methyl ester carboxylesterase [Paenibacillus eucommiae]
MPIRKLNGTSLYYEVHGSGVPLIFIHSHGLTHEMFKPQMEFFQKMCTVITVDLRGNGQSGKLVVSNDEIIETQCEDLRTLLTYIGIQQAVFIGISYGGIVVQKFSCLFPNLVSAIILSDSFCNNVITTTLGKSLQTISAASWFTYYLPGEFFLRSLKIMYNRWDMAYLALRKGILHKRSRELLKQRIAISEIDYTDFLPRVKVPALCLVGDYLNGKIEDMQKTAKLLPDARLEVIADSCDPSNLCQPQRFNEIVQQFLEEQQLLQSREWMQRYSQG